MNDSGEALLEVLGIGLCVLSYGYPLLMLFPGWSFVRGPLLPEPRADLARRREAWAILADLYLDTSFEEHELRAMAERLRATGYTRDELEQILFRELHPLLFVNVLAVAGAWSGFDMAEVEAKILARTRRSLRVWPVPAKWVVASEWGSVRRHFDALNPPLDVAG